MPNALKAVGAAAERAGVHPSQLLGVSRETWRRWSKGTQKPSPAHERGLLAALRRLRIRAPREAELRQDRITVKAKSRYAQDPEPRVLGPSSLEWRGNGPVVDAFLRDGITAAAKAFMDQIGNDHFKEWLSPDTGTSTQAYDVTRIDLLTSHSGRTRRRPA